MDRQVLIQKYKKAALLSRGKYLRQTEFFEKTGVRMVDLIRAGFSSYSQLAAAGGGLVPTNQRADPELVLADVVSVAKKIGRIPTRSEYKAHGHYSGGTAERHLGGEEKRWSGVQSRVASEMEELGETVAISATSRPGRRQVNRKGAAKIDQPSDEPETTAPANQLRTAERERVTCNSCGQATWHEKVAEHRTSWEDDSWGYGVSGGSNLYVFKCCGCDAMVTKVVEWFSEEEPEDARISFYPPRVSRRLPNWSHLLPKDIERVTREIYNALHSDSRTLAVMGARTLIDLVILDKVGDAGSFREKLNAMVQNGFISKINRDVLGAALDTGSAAAHRGLNPTAQTVNELMDIVENVLQAVYLLEDKAKTLRQATPKRAVAALLKPT